MPNWFWDLENRVRLPERLEEALPSIGIVALLVVIVLAAEWAGF